MDSVGSPDRTATCISWDLATGADSSPAASLAQQSFLPELPTRSTRSMPLRENPPEHDLLAHRNQLASVTPRRG